MVLDILLEGLTGDLRDEVAEYRVGDVAVVELLTRRGDEFPGGQAAHVAFEGAVVVHRFMPRVIEHIGHSGTRDSASDGP